MTAMVRHHRYPRLRTQGLPYGSWSHIHLPEVWRVRRMKRDPSAVWRELGLKPTPFRIPEKFGVLSSQDVMNNHSGRKLFIKKQLSAVRRPAKRHAAVIAQLGRQS